MLHLDRAQLESYFTYWEERKDSIKKYYIERNKEAISVMKKAIANYEELLITGGAELDERTDEEVYTLSPLNGKERLQFIKDKIMSHYAYIQLDALYDEVKKKAARLITMQEHQLKR